ncbi:MAG: YdcF family protein [Rhizobiaceae bacterium]|nr:YdcF family protein [Rhizobiaceae bacterium]
MSGLSDTETESAKKPFLGRLIGFISGLGILLVFCLLVFVSIGFIRFGNFVSTLENKPNFAKADAIVVLTGGKDRISTAVTLLQNNQAPRLLISGVHPNTSIDSIAELMKINKSVLNCCVDLDRQAKNTKGNASQTANWVKNNKISKLIVVTSNYHMPRSLREMHDLMPDIQLIPFVVGPIRPNQKKWYSDPTQLRTIAIEYAKYTTISFRMSIDRVDKTLAAYASAYLS